MARQEDKKKRKNCSLCADKVESIDYKDAAKLKRYLRLNIESALDLQMYFVTIIFYCINKTGYL